MSAIASLTLMDHAQRDFQFGDRFNEVALTILSPYRGHW
jgi:hypothetical protein